MRVTRRWAAFGRALTRGLILIGVLVVLLAGGGVLLALRSDDRAASTSPRGPEPEAPSAPGGEGGAPTARSPGVRPSAGRPEPEEELRRALAAMRSGPSSEPGLRPVYRTPGQVRLRYAAMADALEAKGGLGRGDRPREVVEFFRKIAAGEIELDRFGRPVLHGADRAFLRKLMRSGGFSVRVTRPRLEGEPEIETRKTVFIPTRIEPSGQD